MTRRAVLIAPRVGGSGQTPTSLRAMLAAIDMITRAGFELLGVLDPKDSREAHRMVADGVADLIVVTRPDHMPSVRLAADEAWFARPARTPDAVPEGAVRRTQPILRAEASGGPADQRRPQFLERTRPLRRSA